jgi:hypothetical protein
MVPCGLSQPAQSTCCQNYHISLWFGGGGGGGTGWLGNYSRNGESFWRRKVTAPLIGMKGSLHGTSFPGPNINLTALQQNPNSQSVSVLKYVTGHNPEQVSTTTNPGSLLQWVPPCCPPSSQIRNWEQIYESASKGGMSLSCMASYVNP